MHIIWCQDKGLLNSYCVTHYQSGFVWHKISHLEQLAYNDWFVVDLFSPNSSQPISVYVDETTENMLHKKKAYTLFLKNQPVNNPNLVLVVFEYELYTHLKQQLPNAQPTVLKKLTKTTAIGWITQQLNNQKVVWPSDLIDFLASQTSLDAWHLTSEITKLNLLMSSEKTWTELKPVVFQAWDDNMFAVLKYYLQNDQAALWQQLQTFEAFNYDYQLLLNSLIEQLFIIKLQKLHYLKHQSIELLIIDFGLNAKKFASKAVFITSISLAKILETLAVLLKLNENLTTTSIPVEYGLKLVFLNHPIYELQKH